jgi:UDP-N-acetylmuramoyl-L-alanyl-D-glutamate--2,6-diaminopimelate ligase
MMAATTQSQRPTIGDLFGHDAPERARHMEIADITIDSREVSSGSLFLAVAGAERHGLEFLQEAVAAGAVAVAWEPADGFTAPLIAPPAVCFPVPGLGRRLGDIADRFFGQPSRQMDVVGITGTNGKTTCAYLLASSLCRLGRPAGYLGTLGSGFPESLTPARLTTADAIETHRRLSMLADSGATGAAVEISSHALVQHRADGVRFRIAAFTNLSREHLDYHPSMEAYGNTKRSLFEVSGLEWAIANTDDPFGVEMLRAADRDTKTVAVGAAAAPSADRNLVIDEIEFTPQGILLHLDGDWGQVTLKSPLLGEFNAENLALTLAMLLTLAAEPDEARKALSAAHAPPGRMEMFRSSDRAPTIVVDFAHTPDALAKSIAALRSHRKGRVITVFGCGGDRDRGKRPEMGAIAEQASDLVILTDDNPRTEDGDGIIRDIVAGMSRRPHVLRDRRSAILAAYEQASPRDVVLVAGKGHEDYQVVGGQRRPFSDRDVATELVGAQP